jgi:hypothetical protein
MRQFNRFCCHERQASFSTGGGRSFNLPNMEALP